MFIFSVFENLSKDISRKKSFVSSWFGSKRISTSSPYELSTGRYISNTIFGIKEVIEAETQVLLVIFIKQSVDCFDK